MRSGSGLSPARNRRNKFETQSRNPRGKDSREARCYKRGYRYRRRNRRRGRHLDSPRRPPRRPGASRSRPPPSSTRSSPGRDPRVHRSPNRSIALDSAYPRCSVARSRGRWTTRSPYRRRTETSPRTTIPSSRRRQRRRTRRSPPRVPRPPTSLRTTRRYARETRKEISLAQTCRLSSFSIRSFDR